MTTYFSLYRRKDKKADESVPGDFRTPIERDFDRILFSTPVRRLADKTQVFPLEKNDSVRTRLTHSYEVSNLARSIGNALVSQGVFTAEHVTSPERNIPALLAAIGLAHDLGNPPFGHQGEVAIQSWFKRHKSSLLESCGDLSAMQKNDFLEFEGNAQTFRLVTQLQILNNKYGLNLTAATLGALIKYPVASDQVDKKVGIHKKYGFFASEKKIVEEVFEQLGMSIGRRHPLTFIMEACDDIAYLILDAEDAVKKNLASFNDLIGALRDTSPIESLSKEDPASEKRKAERALVDEIVTSAEKKYEDYKKKDISPRELSDIATQRLRTFVIAKMIQCTVDAFLENKNAILDGTFTSDLISHSKARELSERLKKFDKHNAYRAPSVLKLELSGFNILNEIMDLLWIGISKREDNHAPASERTSPFAKYAYGLISENYRRVFEDKNNQLPMRYKELQLLTDMVSGMTDQYAVTFHSHLKKMHNEKYC